MNNVIIDRTRLTGMKIQIRQYSGMTAQIIKNSKNNPMMSRVLSLPESGKTRGHRSIRRANKPVTRVVMPAPSAMAETTLVQDVLFDFTTSTPAHYGLHNSTTGGLTSTPILKTAPKIPDTRCSPVIFRISYFFSRFPCHAYIHPKYHKAPDTSTKYHTTENFRRVDISARILYNGNKQRLLLNSENQHFRRRLIWLNRWKRCD
jgi:hypothetical protein